jgi:hypothetical protein
MQVLQELGPGGWKALDVGARCPFSDPQAGKP